jgi:uncharacterized protein YndB with AHSA1/START domain
MPVTDVFKDPSTLTLAVTTELDAPPERAWELWADPRKLERWWGPPGWPATVVEHELAPGGRLFYFMTGPGGEQPRGYWEVVAVDPPASLEFVNGFADEGGWPDTGMPSTTVTVTLTAIGDGRTRMVILATFPSVEQMEQLVAMGMVEGLTLGVGQIDAILAEVAV